MNLDRDTLANMVDDVGGITHHEEASAETVIKAAINRALAAAAGAGWPQIQRTDDSGVRAAGGTLSTFIADDAHFPGPLGADRVVSIVPQTHGRGPIEIISASELSDRSQGYTNSTGFPECAALVGQTIQHREAEGSSLTCSVTNTVATMDNSKTLRVDYERNGEYVGNQGWEDVDGAFSAGVNLNARVNGPYGLRRLSVPAGWVGNISFTINSVVVAFLRTREEPPTNTNDAHTVVARPLYRLWPVPDLDYACTVTWQRQPLKLTEDEDVPEIPVSPFLVLAAAADIFRSLENNVPMADRYDAQATRALRGILSQYRGTHRAVSIPYMGNFVDQTGGR